MLAWALRIMAAGSGLAKLARARRARYSCMLHVHVLPSIVTRSAPLLLDV